jgi:hypothetical protein
MHLPAHCGTTSLLRAVSMAYRAAPWGPCMWISRLYRTLDLLWGACWSVSLLPKKSLQMAAAGVTVPTGQMLTWCHHQH